MDMKRILLMAALAGMTLAAHAQQALGPGTGLISPEIHPDKSRTAHKCADFSLPSSGHENKTFLQ